MPVRRPQVAFSVLAPRLFSLLMLSFNKRASGRVKDLKVPSLGRRCSNSQRHDWDLFRKPVVKLVSNLCRAPLSLGPNF
ncbi:hypothetical protein FN846DRAFT_937501 [Sphaerosporella brunnea]|uniref:Secreted protein n=1 Tax=Sphaerosporella brunnea TaxID=1250544 RepID=A0A5J5F483_9PEZI|nr:hypothetical protein FN846DRAFT_937501 [Sphaerosporella brunnea]